MSQLSDYTQDEIEKLLAAPLLVGMYVMGASLSGALGLMQEMIAAVETAMNTARSVGADSILHELYSEEHLKKQEAMLRAETREATDQAQDLVQARAAMLDRAQAAVRIIDARGDAGEAAAYRAMLLRAADNVARAAKEGGFMGLGGERVNEKERQALREIRSAVEGNR